MDLAASADALHDRANRIYEWKFLRGLRQRIKRKATLYPGRYDTAVPAGRAQLARLRRPDHGTLLRLSRRPGLLHARGGLAQCFDRIAVPTLILHAEDDPFIRVLPATRARSCCENPHITYLETAARRTLRVPRRGQWIRRPLGRAPGYCVRAASRAGRVRQLLPRGRISDGC